MQNDTSDGDDVARAQINLVCKSYIPQGTPIPNGPRKELWGWRNLHYLNDFVRVLLGLSKDEQAVLDAVRSYQMSKKAADIANASKVDRQTTNRILRRLETRQIVIRFTKTAERDTWGYNGMISNLSFQFPEDDSS